ncbi:unnamed protein product [Linum trigynum]|uniref:Cysteine proteinase inhibitor n=1 Tax=Linum trigynum TaxID=586398 RepID=A0AAV2D3I5_9ROSI
MARSGFLVFCLVSSLLIIGAMSSVRLSLSDTPWQPIRNLKDEHILEIAEFAVKYINKENGSGAQAVLASLDKAALLPDCDGFLYRVAVTLAEEQTTESYEAVISEKPGNKFLGISNTVLPQ